MRLLRNGCTICAVLVIVLVMSSLGWPQGGSISGQIVSPPTPAGTGQPVPFAQIRVCPYGSTGTPCSPLSPNVYADPTLLTPLGNPFSTDGNGNYSVFLPTGAYEVQASAPVGAGYSFVYSSSLYVNGTGTVSSVGLSLPTSLFLVTNSPVTTNGTLTAQFIGQPANQVFGNCTGSTNIPAFCSLTANMLPTTLNATIIDGLTVAGNTSISGNLAVGGSTALTGTSITGNLSVTGTLGIAGTAALEAGGSLTGNFTGNPTFSGNPVFSGTPSFTGIPAFSALNLTTGIQLGGSYSTSGYYLTSTGTGTTFTAPPTLYYQVVNANGTGVTQRPALNFSNQFVLTDNSSPAETNIGLAALPGTVSGNGYVQLPGGVILQWFTTSGFNSGGAYQSVSGTFPTAFPNAVFSVNCTPSMYGSLGGTASPANPTTILVNALSKTGYTATANTTNSGITLTDGTVGYCMAVGN